MTKQQTVSKYISSIKNNTERKYAQNYYEWLTVKTPIMAYSKEIPVSAYSGLTDDRARDIRTMIRYKCKCTDESNYRDRMIDRVEKVNKLFDDWNTDVELTLETGKGKYSDLIVADLFDYKKIINLVREGKTGKAALMFENLDTFVREYVPTRVKNFFYSIGD